MSENFALTIKKIDALQGHIYQTLMDAFNELSEIYHEDPKQMVGNVQNMAALKVAILGALKKPLDYINADKFWIACLTCSTLRLFGLLKYVILKKHLTNEDLEKYLGEIKVEYKVDKKYTEYFYDCIEGLKTNISQIITNKNLRKKYTIDRKCLTHLAQEKKALAESYGSDTSIHVPEWLDAFDEASLLEFSEQLITAYDKKDFVMLKNIIDKTFT